jgi:hypothetical protein
VNPQQLLGIIERADHLSNEDFDELMKLHKAFPYFQIPKVLLAKREFDQSKGQVKEMLHWAAVTSPDRVWLKEMVETQAPFQKPKANPTTNIEDTKIEKVEEIKNSPIQIQDEALIPEPQKAPSNKDLTATLKKLGEDLALSKMRALQQLEGNSIQPKLEPKFPENITPETSTTISKDILPEGTDVSTDKDAEIKPTKKTKRRASKDELIESIRKKEKKEILDKKKLEQLDIIKAFSKKEIKLATLKEIEGIQKQDDLSEKSTQLHSALITEAYASILVKQGKVGKAKEIYKKLMVRFPEKSTYFADLIKRIE